MIYLHSISIDVNKLYIHTGQLAWQWKSLIWNRLCIYIYIQYIVIQLTVVQLVHFHSYRYQCLPKCWYNERNV